MRLHHRRTERLESRRQSQHDAPARGPLGGVEAVVDFEQILAVEQILARELEADVACGAARFASERRVEREVRW